MAASLIVLTLCIAVAVGSGIPAAKNPAGINPYVCPNYLNCNNVAMAVGHNGSITQYASPAYGNHGAGTKYPAWVSPEFCPKYPYCGLAPALAFA